jgi:hypothetical protein
MGGEQPGGSGPGCEDPGPEPNNTESSATDLGTITDCDEDGGSFSGMVAGIDDLDWYKYQASDDFFCVVDATREVQSNAPVRFCKYFQCIDDSTPAFSCPNGSNAATSPDGRPGCCADSGFDVAPDCANTSDDVKVYMSVRTLANECVTYTVNYHY